MSFFSTAEATPVGKGTMSPAGSVTDPELAARVSGYKRQIAGRYRSVAPHEVATHLPTSPTLVSPKVDGQFWCLVVRDRQAALVSPRGKVLSGQLPVLIEIQAKVVPRLAPDATLIAAGELFALRKGGRPRVADVSSALAGGAEAEVGRIGFFAFDLLEGGDAESPEPLSDYPGRLDTLRRLFAGGQRAQAIKTELVHTPAEVSERFAEWAEGGKGEGLVVRPEDGRIFKLKPIFTFDAAVIGFTEKNDEPEHVRSLLLAMLREDGQFQLVGSVGNLGTDELRAELYRALKPKVVPSSYRFASSTGALYRFVDPELVVEVKVTDIQVEDGSGRPVRRMVLELDGEDGWSPLQLRSGVSLIHPIMGRVREDKTVNATDVRASQILERVEVPELEEKVVKIVRPESTVVRREVFSKTTKGKTAVRKLLVWETGKTEIDPTFPAFVVHWTDFSPGRKQPLQREVRLAPDRETADELAQAMLTAGVKKGWKPAETEGETP
ncbi:MAG: hypothetical protein AAGM22_28015 [Acidobacteriota bacterium]